MTLSQLCRILQVETYSVIRYFFQSSNAFVNLLFGLPSVPCVDGAGLSVVLQQADQRGGSIYLYQCQSWVPRPLLGQPV